MYCFNGNTFARCRAWKGSFWRDRYKNKRPVPCFRKERGVTLATSYFRVTYRDTIIGAAAFHFRVRNGNGWCHCAGITRRLLVMRFWALSPSEFLMTVPDGSYGTD